MLKDASEELSDSKPLELKRLGIDEVVGFQYIKRDARILKLFQLA